MGQAELRTEKRLCFCELPDSLDSSVDASSSDESDDDNLDYGALIDQVDQRNQVSQKSGKLQCNSTQ